MKQLLFAAAAILFAATACSTIIGEEIARLPVNEVSTDKDKPIYQEIAIDLKKDESIVIWSDMDISYAGEVEL